ncbi:sterol 3-beta-glucosyltransferase UGT80A2-like isoform X2 [Tripterygium wilfordii]|uniref:sterol 3-beta-glucosyltransferase UGT80A2-like isoform X2 n=1 Tax=Tripterygium wilfordii TaxID=458696 RepID=UPI0018F80CFD|nr:sterol 3-beta-glucosyltransferase UGT80A2-like isoform X2 [Tripterygium wilfordii]
MMASMDESPRNRRSSSSSSSSGEVSLEIDPEIRSSCDSKELETSAATSTAAAAGLVNNGDTGSSSSSSSSSGEVSLEVDPEIRSGCDSKELETREACAATAVAGFVNNGGTGSPGTSGRTSREVNTLHMDVPSVDKSEPTSSHHKLEKSKSEANTLHMDVSSVDKSEPTLSKLEKSKTERQRHNILAGEAAQIFDNKISVRQKLKLLNRIATVKDDGTVEFEVPGDVEPRALDTGSGSEDVCNAVVDDGPLDATDFQYIPPIQIVILIVGTRGDVQPFIAIGKCLQDYGHRVRLATHSNFKEFVLTAGLEFYPLGGDPKILAGHMVKNKGFLPSGPSEIPVQRNQMKEIIYSLLPACKDPDMDTGIAFKADAIIANPPAYGQLASSHILCPVSSNLPDILSYQIVDSLIWLGIRDMINDLRKKKLKLRPVTYLSGSQGSDSDVPHGYIWSPHLVPKPKDWGPKIDVVGFCFLDLASNYEPPESLIKWLEAGTEPIYIGFGSLPVQEPEKMTQIIVEALEQTGQRGIINKGWGGLGNLAEPKDFIYLLDNCPHDWLFLQCKAVVHHGGAGTTAAGLKAACPTTVVPFFGDQPFWGERVHDRGVGPAPIPVDEFSLPKLVEAIKFMLDPEVKKRSVELAKAMETEDGVNGAVKAFFKHLPRKKPEPVASLEHSSIFSFKSCFGCCS